MLSFTSFRGRAGKFFRISLKLCGVKPVQITFHKEEPDRRGTKFTQEQKTEVS